MAGSEEALGPVGQRLSSPSAQIAFQDRAGTEPEWISIAQRCLLYTCAGKQHQIQTLPRSGGICPGTLHRDRPPRSERLSRQFWDTRDQKKSCPRQKSHSVLYFFCPLPLFPPHYPSLNPVCEASDQVGVCKATPFLTTCRLQSYTGSWRSPLMTWTRQTLVLFL